MENIIHLKPLDPIISEFNEFVDKDAGLKTIAFKYFKADLNQATEYLKVPNLRCDNDKNNLSIVSIITKDSYYQPELI